MNVDMTTSHADRRQDQHRRTSKTTVDYQSFLKL